MIAKYQGHCKVSQPRANDRKQHLNMYHPLGWCVSLDSILPPHGCEATTSNFTNPSQVLEIEHRVLHV
jgi:hypothetical protein